MSEQAFIPKLEKVVWLMNKMGIETGIDAEKLKLTADFAKKIETNSFTN